MSWTERLNDVLPRVRLGASVVEIHEWAHMDQPMDSPPHRHSYFLVGRVEAGEGEFTAAGRCHHVGPGDLLFARPGMRHRTVGAEGFRISSIAFEVAPGAAGDDDDLSRVLQGFLAADSTVVRGDGHVAALWGMLKEAAQGPRTPGQRAALAVLAPALLVSLARVGGGEDAQAGPGRAGLIGMVETRVGSAGTPRSFDGAGPVRDGAGGGLPGGDGDGVGSSRGEELEDAGSARGGDGAGSRDGDGAGLVRVSGGEGLGRVEDGEAEAATPEPVPGRHLRAVRMAVRYIEDNLDRPLRVEELAKQVGVSPRQLTRLFATVLNEPPASYVERVRLERAAGLLARTDRPIKQIAAELGYPDVPTFTRAFTRQHQSPPGRFRRTHLTAVNEDRAGTAG